MHTYNRAIIALRKASLHTREVTMKEIISTVTSEGQITIPAEVRERLGLAAGDKLAFVIGDEGQIEVRPVRYSTVASLRGAAGSLPVPLSWQGG